MATFVNDSMTNSLLISRLDWCALAFEDANSKFLDIVSFADDDAKECVDHS